MGKIRIAVVEDEPIVAMDIAANLEAMGYEVLGPFDRGSEIIKLIKDNPPDLILLDIQIEGDLDGIETAEIINTTASIPIIFITASSDKATKERAQKVRPHAYIIKPFNFQNLHAAIELALFNYCHSTSADETKIEDIPDFDGYPGRRSIFVRQTKSRIFEKLPLEDVILMEAHGSYSKIVTTNNKLTICSNLQSIIDKIDHPNFIRIHRSFAINIDHVESVSDDELVVGKSIVPVSSTYKQNLFDKMKLL